MSQKQIKIQRRLNVYGAGHSQHHQTGFNRSYYTEHEENHEYLSLDSSGDDTIIRSFAQVVQYGSIGEEFGSEKELFASGEYVAHVSSGENHSLFVTNMSRVFCCGDNSYGACAFPHDISTVEQVTLISELSNCGIVETMCGSFYSYFVSEGYESVFVAGFNTHGECGLSTGTHTIHGVARLDSVDGKKLKHVALGAYHTVFVTVDNCVYTNGYRAYGSLGQGRRKSTDPLAVDHPDLCGLKIIKSAHCGQWHSIVIAQDGSAYSWGKNNHGQCGFNSSSPLSVPSPIVVTGIPTDEKVVDARCGANFTVFRTLSNKFFGCGENSNGALGLATNLIQSIVTQIPLAIGIVLNYSCGVNFTVFTTKEGRLYICGYKGFVVYLFNHFFHFMYGTNSHALFMWFSSDERNVLLQLNKESRSVVEVDVPFGSKDASHDSEIRVACAPTGHHILLYNVNTSLSIPNKLFVIQHKRLMCDTIIVTKR